MYAIVKIAGQQFKATPNSILRVPKLEAEVGGSVKIAAEGRKCFQFSELGHLEPKRSGNLLHGLNLGRAADP